MIGMVLKRLYYITNFSPGKKFLLQLLRDIVKKVPQEIDLTHVRLR